MSRRVTELPTETENVAWPQAWGGVTKPTARGPSEPPIPPCDPTRALTASASLTWSSMSLRAGGSPDAAHSGTVMTAGKRRLHPEENSASRGGVSSSRIAQNQDNALPGDDLLETWSLREAASLQPNHCQGRRPTSLGMVSHPLPDQENTSGLARCPSPGDSWCLDREFRRSNELDKPPSLAARFTDLKTEGRRGKGFPRPCAVPPGALKASCLTSWNTQNALSTSAHETGNSSFGDKKNKPTNQQQPALLQGHRPRARAAAHGFGVDFVFAVL